jgi:hypothetical protein
MQLRISSSSGKKPPSFFRGEICSALHSARKLTPPEAITGSIPLSSRSERVNLHWFLVAAAPPFFTSCSSFSSSAFGSSTHSSRRNHVHHKIIPTATTRYLQSFVHFLCTWRVWTAPLKFMGTAAGCELDAVSCVSGRFE